MSKDYRLLAQQLFDGEKFWQHKVLTIADGVITAIDDDVSRVDQRADGMLVPGFIDLQVNGGGGVLFNNDASLDGLQQMAAAHARFGTTAMLPTLITDEVAVMAQAADAVAEALAQNSPGILGIHFEGPHLSQAKKGAHSSAYIRPLSAEEWRVLARHDLGQVLVTLAPETVASADIERMAALGIKVCLGHSDADFACAEQALAAGADGFTHLFNAMSPLQGRAPGMVGCALLHDEASVGLIVDGHHVDYASCRLAIKCKPAGKVFLVTDAMPPVATGQTSFAFFGREVSLHDGKLTSSTGELAGSVLDMATAVRNCHQQLGVELAEALRMASSYPANYIGKGHQLGRLDVGYQADMVLLDEQLTVQATWIAGHQVFNHTAP